MSGYIVLQNTLYITNISEFDSHLGIPTELTSDDGGPSCLYSEVDTNIFQLGIKRLLLE